MDFSIPPHLEEKLRVVRGFLIEELFPLERGLLTRPFRERAARIYDGRTNPQERRLSAHIGPLWADRLTKKTMSKWTQTASQPPLSTGQCLGTIQSSQITDAGDF